MKKDEGTGATIRSARRWPMIITNAQIVIAICTVMPPATFFYFQSPRGQEPKSANWIPQRIGHRFKCNNKVMNFFLQFIGMSLIKTRRKFQVEMCSRTNTVTSEQLTPDKLRYQQLTTPSGSEPLRS